MKFGQPAQLTLALFASIQVLPQSRALRQNRKARGISLLQLIGDRWRSRLTNGLRHQTNDSISSESV